jgi:hypothetical protein
MNLDNIPTIISDTGWSGKEFARFRGITDYERIIEFGRVLTAEERARIKEFLQNDNCPGWTGVEINQMDQFGKYKFLTTWDSSD